MRSNPFRLAALPLLLCILALPSVAWAQPTDDADESTVPAVPFPKEAPPTLPPAESKLLTRGLRLEVSGVLYAFWSADLAAANPDAPSPNGANRFELSRAFIDVIPQIGDSISLRITPDLVRVSGAEGNIDGNLALRLFFAYVRFADVLPGVSVIAGLQPSPLTSFDDALWQYRVLGPSIFTTLTGLPTSDLGVGVTGHHLDGLLEYQLLLSNGEGANRPESSSRESAKFKDGSGRLSLAPFTGSSAPWLRRLRLSALANYGIERKLDDRHLDRVRLLGLASLEHRLGTLAAGAGPTWDGVRDPDDGGVTTRNGLLFTTFGFINLPYDLRLLGRFDLFNPDVDHSAKTSPENQTTGQRTRIIGGVAYRVNELVQLVVDYQRFGFEVAERTPPGAVGDLLFLHMEARY